MTDTSTSTGLVLSLAAVARSVLVAAVAGIHQALRSVRASPTDALRSA
ncbi:hypothetical protein [Streptomyces sp. E-08]